MKKRIYDFIHQVKELAPPILGAIAITALVYVSKNKSADGAVYSAGPNSTNVVSGLEKSLEE